MTAAHQLGQKVGRAAACRALNVPRASLYRHLRPSEPVAPAAPRPSPPRTLTSAEQQRVLDVLHSERFQDKAPNEVFATLLDEGTYLCSVRTMYRILQQAGEVRERRAQLRHPNYQKPQLLATGANQVHQTAGPQQGRLLLLVRDDRHLQPLRGRLADRRSRIG